jgi:uncharacterized protein YgiM (DUF1202 family)
MARKISTANHLHPLKLRAIRLTRQAIRQAVLSGAITGALASLVVSLLLALLTGCVPWPPETYVGLEITPTPSFIPPSVTTTLKATETPTSTPTLLEGKVCHVATGVDAGNLNLRTGPGTSYPVITILTEGETLTVLSPRVAGAGSPGSWSKVARADGTQGYINSIYCKGA